MRRRRLRRRPRTTGAFTERPGDALSRNLRSLAANPKSVTALMGAGKAALDLGDAQAALTFFARAEEQLPRDGRIKMWIGSALVQLQQPHAALKFFRDAAELGVPDAEIAARPRASPTTSPAIRARRSATIGWRFSAAATTRSTRRLALSLAISGEREPALRLLEDQLLVRDRAAERTRALVLALTGDTAGAARAAQAAMPGPQASAMAPVPGAAADPVARPSGRWPSISASSPATAAPPRRPPMRRTISPTRSPTPAGPTRPRRSLARRSAAARAGLDRAAPPPRRGGGSPRGPPSVASPTPSPARPARSQRSGGGNPAWAWSRGLDPSQRPAGARSRRPNAPTRRRPRNRSAARDGRRRPAKPPASRPSTSAQPEPAAGRRSSRVPAASRSPNRSRAEIQIAAAEPPAPPPQAEAVPAGSRLADLSAAIATIDDPAGAGARAVAAQAEAGGARAAAPAAAKPPAKKPKPAPPPSRAGSGSRSRAAPQKAALPREFARLKAKAPKVFGGRGAWTAPLNATNRLLVGPFASSKEAQAFVNQLKAADLSGFAWTSAAGQKVEKLPGQVRPLARYACDPADRGGGCTASRRGNILGACA